MWLHGQGLPKGCNISTELSRMSYIAPEQRLKATHWMRETAKRLGVTDEAIILATGKKSMHKYWLARTDRPILPSLKDWEKLEPLLGTPPDWFIDLLNIKANEKSASDMEIIGRSNAGFSSFFGSAYNLTAPTNPNAKLWHGWHTALKPAWEPIILAKKRMPSSYVDNAVVYGVGGLNVAAAHLGGRWPANVVHDGSLEVTEALGSASRLFHCPKASRKDRGKDNTHPTVKPQGLMEHLIKLVTMPENNLILDPFMGSGSTLMACQTLGMPCIGIEAKEEYCQIAATRLSTHADTYAAL
jgi:hypothetical protein